MAVSINYHMRLTVLETLDLNHDFATNPVIQHTLGTEVKGVASGATAATLGTSGPITKIYSDQIALSGGAATIDLMVLPQSAGGDITQNVSFSGLKVQFYLFENPSTNANAITIDGDGTHPYELFGGATGLVTLEPGESIMGRCPETRGAVVSDTTDKITLAGTSAQVLNVMLVAG